MSIPQETRNLHTPSLSIVRQDREDMNGHKGRVIWFTGLSGSGKSTMANALEVELHARGLLPNMTGLNSPYEVPERPDIALNCSNSRTTESLGKILNVVLPLQHPQSTP